MYAASCKGYAQIVELLLRRAADVDLQTMVRLLCVFPDMTACTTLHIAIHMQGWLYNLPIVVGQIESTC